MTGYLRFFRGESPLLSYGLVFAFFSSFGQTFLISVFVPEFLEQFSLTAMARYWGASRGKALSISGVGFSLGEASLPILAALRGGPAKAA